MTAERLLSFPGLSRLSGRRWLPVALIGLFVYLLISLLTLGISPVPSADEGWFAQVMEDMRRHHWPLNSRVLGILGMDEDTVFHGRVYVALGAWVGGLSPASLWAPRLLSFLGFAVGLLFYYFWLRRIYGEEISRWAVIVLAGSTLTFLVSHTIRPEAVVLGALLPAFYLADKSFRSGSRVSSLLSGFLAGVALDIHVASSGLICVLALGWLMEYGRNLFRQRQFWIWAGGVVPGVLWWLSSHVLRNPDVFFRQWAVLAGPLMNPAPYVLSLNPLDWFSSELVAIWNPFGYSRLSLGYVSLTLFGVALVMAIGRKDRRDRRMVLSLAGLFVFQSVFSQNKFGWYTVYYLPFLCALVARLAVPGEMSRKLRFQAVGGVLVILYLAVNSGQIGGRIWLDRREARVQEHEKILFSEIPSGASVVASSTLFFMQPPFRWVDADFFKIFPLVAGAEQRRFGRTIEEVIERAGISHFIVNSESDPVLAGIEGGRHSPPLTALTVEASQFIQQHTSLIKIVDAGRQGRYVVRRVLRPGDL